MIRPNPGIFFFLIIRNGDIEHVYWIIAEIAQMHNCLDLGIGVAGSHTILPLVKQDT